MPGLHTIDYLVLGVYALLVIAVCIKVTRRSPDSDELFLAGRSLGPAVIGLSLFASNISSTTLIGLPGAAWETGISVANYEWMAGLILIFSAIFVVPVFIRRGLTTVPELLEQRFDARLRKYLSGASVFLSIVLDTAGSIYAGSLVLMLFIPGLDLVWTCVAMAIFAGIYTAAGGLRAVAYTDVIQAIILLLGSFILSILVFNHFDFSWASVKAQLDPDKLSLIRPMDDPALPWLGTLIGLPILGFYYWTMNQYVAQRLLGARDADAAGKGALLAAALKLLPLFFMVLPGAMAAAIFTDLERADTVFPRLIGEFAPPGLAGVLIAGLMAAIMSSVDSALNSASTLIMVDFVKPRRPAMTHAQVARAGRYVTLLLMVFAAAWAPMIDNFPGLFAYLQQAFSYVASPLVAVFLLGVFGRRLGAEAALRGLISGHIFSLLLFVGAQLGWHDIHFTLVAGLLFVVTGVLALIWQLLLPGGSYQPDSTQLSVVDPEAHHSVSASIKRGALAITGITAMIVIAFW